MSDDDLTATSDDAAHDCDNCGAMMDEEDLVMHCPATFCPHVYCRHCVPVWCDGCGRLIGPDPAKTTPNPDRRIGEEKPEQWKPSGQVFIKNGVPYLAHRGWLWKRNGDGGWFNIARLPALVMTDGHICTPEETALYGVNYSEDIHGD